MDGEWWIYILKNDSVLVKNGVVRRKFFLQRNLKNFSFILGFRPLALVVLTSIKLFYNKFYINLIKFLEFVKKIQISTITES
jgi:hypothetical protein